MKWHVIHHCLEFEYYPHEKVEIEDIKWKNYPGALMARWTTDFDCQKETQFWYCIKNEPFDIDAIKAKRRYEINKGNKNFYTKIIDPSEYKEQLYEVYCESLKGYEGNSKLVSERDFFERSEKWSNIKEQVMFGCFRREDDKLCGYSDVYRRDPYLPISSLKTIPETERGGVNFALIFGILEYFREELQNGCYLCDGARALVHKTHFQDYLEKYFGFRKAYCVLNIKYRFLVGATINALFPFRKRILNSRFKTFYPLLKMEAWRRNLEE